MDEHLERNYLEVELHEKVVVRERRRKGILIGIALVLFLFLCGVPVFNERLPKWESLQAARTLAIELEKLKTESLRLKKPLRMSVSAAGQLEVVQVQGCEASADGTQVAEEKVYSRNWHQSTDALSLMGESEAKSMKMKYVVNELCFDPVSGLHSPKTKKVFVILPVKDLAESRLDRASYVEVESQTAKISIN